MNKKHSQEGISLIELVVMLVLIAVLSKIAIPGFVQLINRYRISSTAESFYYALQYARSEAVKRNANVYFSFSPGSNWCYGISTGSACNCTIANNCNLHTNAALKNQQITLSQTGYGSNNLYFEGTHGAASASGSLTLTLYGTSSLITLNISRLGNIQMCSTGISGYTAC